MSKTQYVMEPVDITVAELKAMANVCVPVKKYVDAMQQFLPQDPKDVAGAILVQGYNGLPVLSFKPKRSAVVDLLRNKMV